LNVSMSMAILTISTIIAASIFSGAAITQLYSFQNVLRDVGQSNQDVLSSSIKVIGEAQTSTPSYISVWIKNTGRTSFRLNGGTVNASYWDVFLTFPNGTYTRFPYSTSASVACWKATILSDMVTVGVWEKGETIEIKIYTSSVPSGSYKIKLALPNGVGDEDQFSLGS